MDSGNGTRSCYVAHSFDLNVPCDEMEPSDADVVSPADSVEPHRGRRLVGCKRKGSSAQRCNAKVYQDCRSTRGGRTVSHERPANVICRVEDLGKIIGSFDDRRRRWVCEMGFGGLLFLVNRKLPRALCALCYWLITRIDPDNERLNVGTVNYRLSCIQVKWVLGLPKGDRRVPYEYGCEASYRKVVELEKKFGQVWTSVDGQSGKVVERKGFAVRKVVVDRLMSKFEENEADEFKMLFLMVALDMVLCPTQCSWFPRELLPALSCASEAKKYNWCTLVLEKLIDSVKRFADRNYSDGFAGGCGGCALFIAIFYLDRLDRYAIKWGQHPRIKVWSDCEIRKACDDDRLSADGDFGAVGVLDVAYGEKHPNDARDVDLSDDEFGFC